MLNDNKTNLSCSLIFNHQSVWRRVPPGPNQSPTSQLKAQDSIKHFILRSKIVSQLTWRSSWQWTRRWCLRWRVQQEDEDGAGLHITFHVSAILQQVCAHTVHVLCRQNAALSIHVPCHFGCENIGNCRRTYRWWSQCTPLSLWLVRARSCWTFCILVLASSRCDRSVLAQRPLDLWIDWRHHPSRLTKPRQWARPWNGPSETHRCSPSSHFCKISSGNHPRSSCHCHCWIPGSLERKNILGGCHSEQYPQARHRYSWGNSPHHPRFGVHHPSESACSRGSDWGNSSYKPRKWFQTLPTHWMDVNS